MASLTNTTTSNDSNNNDKRKITKTRSWIPVILCLIPAGYHHPPILDFQHLPLPPQGQKDNNNTDKDKDNKNDKEVIVEFLFNPSWLSPPPPPTRLSTSASSSFVKSTHWSEWPCCRSSFRGRRGCDADQKRSFLTKDDTIWMFSGSNHWKASSMFQITYLQICTNSSCVKWEACQIKTYPAKKV